MSKLRKFTAVLEPETDGGFSVYIPGLPGCNSQGNTREEAIANIREALSLYLEHLDANDQPVPSGNTWESVEIEIPA
jgi:predicted RNase H-like HicB family nuclease